MEKKYLEKEGGKSDCYVMNHVENVRDIRDKTMAYKFMCIPIDHIQNYFFCRLKLVVENLT